jgi:enoyl-CoA hydratase/carnithine racemase
MLSPASSAESTRSIAVEVRGRIVTITLSDPDTCNALTVRMWRELAAAVTTFSGDPGVGAIILRGEGTDFSSGANIRDLPDDPALFHAAHLAAEEAVASASVPVIAAIRSHCVGGGCEIAVAADFRFADRSAVFGITASRLGIVYPETPTRRLVEVVGAPTARRILYGGELFDAAWADRVGLVTEVVDGDVDERARDFAGLLATRSPASVQGAKQLIGGRLQAAPRESAEEYREGVRAFRERRLPRFGK